MGWHYARAATTAFTYIYLCAHLHTRVVRGFSLSPYSDRRRPSVFAAKTYLLRNLCGRKKSCRCVVRQTNKYMSSLRAKLSRRVATRPYLSLSLSLSLSLPLTLSLAPFRRPTTTRFSPSPAHCR